MSTLEELYRPGLEGIPACRSRIGYIDGQKGILEYRSIRIEALAENSTFEETSYLLLNGLLPNKEELSTFDWDIRRHRRLKGQMIEILKAFPRNAHPMDVLQTAVSSLGMFFPEDDPSLPAARYHAVCRILAKIPTIIAAYHRLRNDKEPILPNDDLPHAANFLHMLTGEVPSAADARFLDVCFILHAEHTLNASTFSARVTGSTLADPYCVITSAIGTLTGPLHGGANEAVVEMFREIGSVSRVASWMDEKIAAKEKIMGLGHRIYKTKDPRAIVLQTAARKLFELRGDDEMLAIAEEVERVALDKLAPKGIFPNIDFYSGIVYRKIGIPEDLNTALFATSRTAGWLAHWLEQMDGNRLFRPTQIYDGGHDLPYVPVVSRI